MEMGQNLMKTDGGAGTVDRKIFFPQPNGSLVPYAVFSSQ
jgi:hypothetical protein